jgi:hypothetical protein
VGLLRCFYLAFSVTVAIVVGVGPQIPTAVPWRFFSPDDLLPQALPWVGSQEGNYDSRLPADCNRCITGTFTHSTLKRCGSRVLQWGPEIYTLNKEPFRKNMHFPLNVL